VFLIDAKSPVLEFTVSGAKRLVPCGLGDDDQCIDDDFTAWYSLFWLTVQTLCCFYIMIEQNELENQHVLFQFLTDLHRAMQLHRQLQLLLSWP
jgi:hypothetical protein